MNAHESKSVLVIVLGIIILNHFFLQLEWLFMLAILIGVISLSFEFLGKLLVKGWMKLAEGLGWFNSKVILGIVFFIFLFPIAVLYRLSNKNPLQLKNPKGSMFYDRNHQYTAKDLENIW